MSDCLDCACDGGLTDAIDCECECERCTDCSDAIADCDTEDCVDGCMCGVGCCAELAIKAQRKAATTVYRSSKDADVSSLDSNNNRDASVGPVPIVPVAIPEKHRARVHSPIFAQAHARAGRNAHPEDTQETQMDECGRACCVGICYGGCITVVDVCCRPLCDGCANCCCGAKGFSCCSRNDDDDPVARAYREQSSLSPNVVPVAVKTPPAGKTVPSLAA